MKELGRGLKITLVFMIVLGIIYPLTVTGLSRLFFPYKSQGSLVKVDGKVVGSKLLGQKFTEDKWFIGRPSVNSYDGLKSGGSNLSLTNPNFKEEVDKNIEDFMDKNNGIKRADIPVDIVTSSSSSLDPDISVQAAKLQVSRVARNNNLKEEDVLKLIDENLEGKLLNLYGNERVNVLELNLALQKIIK